MQLQFFFIIFFISSTKIGLFRKNLKYTELQIVKDVKFYKTNLKHLIYLDFPSAVATKQ